MSGNTSIKETIQQWCQKHLDNTTTAALDEGRLSAATLYREFAGEGFLVELLQAGGLKQLPDVISTVAAYSGALTNAIAVNFACAAMLQAFGDQAQQHIAKNILLGQSSGAFLLTEENAGSDVSNMQTLAEKTEEHWEINGEKWFATGAADAEYLLLVARHPGDTAIQKNCSIYCLKAETKGITITPMEKISSRGFASCYVTFNNVCAPLDSCLGDAGSAWPKMAYTGTLERLLVAISSNGLSRRIWEYSRDFAQQRYVDGKAIIQQQSIAHSLVDAETKLISAELVTEKAMQALLSGENPGPIICRAKYYSSDVQQELTQIAMRILGGRAYLENYPLARWSREAQLALYAGGTNEIQKNIIARILQK